MTEPMTEAIARSIVAALAANFGPWEEDRRRLWQGKVAELEDGEAAWDAAQALIETHEGGRMRFAEYRTAYLGARRAIAERRSRERGLTERHFGIPSWVYVWTWARRYREPVEERTFPQQKPGVDEYAAANPEVTDPTQGRPYMSEEEYDALHDEWVAAGAPRFDPRAMVGAA